MRIDIWRQPNIKRLIALFWQKADRAQYHIATVIHRHGTIISIAVLALLLVFSACLHNQFQQSIAQFLASSTNISNLRSLFLNLGSALIGASAIAFSLVVFAMQVNVERMPHGLFRKLSSDPPIIVSFVGTFSIAISIACCSLIPDSSWAAYAIIGSSWGIVFILGLFFHAYRRALQLINPISQLGIIVNDTDREMKKWSQRIERVLPLFKNDPEQNNGDTLHQNNLDINRIAYFQINPHWTAKSLRAIQYAISYARRYAEIGDHEVSSAALNAIIAANRSYITTKGKTFFSNNPLIGNQLANDGFINNTLEHLRQNYQAGISRGDEQQIIQTLQTFATLAKVYIEIEYSEAHAAKSHSQLAAHYLSDAIEAVLPHGMPDVLMEGVRLEGQTAHLFLQAGNANEISQLSSRIGTIACVGAVNEKFRPVTQVAVEQLAKLTFNLIRSEAYDIGYAADELKQNILLIVKIFLKVPDAPLLNIHSTNLAAYYSSTTTSSLISWLTDLANAVSEAKPDDKKAKLIVRHIEAWANKLHQAEKDIFILAIESKSFFVFDMIYWITFVAKLLMAVSNTEACDKHLQEKLRKHALWLICIFSCVPDDKESISVVENYHLTENLFEVALDAHYRECDVIFEEVNKLLLNWAFKAGKYESGWGTLEQSFYGLATLALTSDVPNAVNNLKIEIQKRVAAQDSPSQDIKLRTARNILRKSTELGRESFYSHSPINIAMSEIDPAKTRVLLEDLANILSRNPHFSYESSGANEP